MELQDKIKSLEAELDKYEGAISATGATWGTETRETARNKVNKWIKSSPCELNKPDDVVEENTQDPCIYQKKVTFENKLDPNDVALDDEENEREYDREFIGALGVLNKVMCDNEKNDLDEEDNGKYQEAVPLDNVAKIKRSKTTTCNWKETCHCSLNNVIRNGHDNDCRRFTVSNHGDKKPDAKNKDGGVLDTTTKGGEADISTKKKKSYKEASIDDKDRGVDNDDIIAKAIGKYKHLLNPAEGANAMEFFETIRREDPKADAAITKLYGQVGSLDDILKLYNLVPKKRYGDILDYGDEDDGYKGDW